MLRVNIMIDAGTSFCSIATFSLIVCKPNNHFKNRRAKRGQVTRVLVPPECHVAHPVIEVLLYLPRS